MAPSPRLELSSIIPKVIEEKIWYLIKKDVFLFCRITLFGVVSFPVTGEFWWQTGVAVTIQLKRLSFYVSATHT
jgi:hypothetical protein